MSILAISVPVPASGEGSAVDVSSLVQKKTVILTGTFRGIYVLLASHDDVHYVPVLQFDAGGAEGGRQTIAGAFKSVRLRAGTPTTAPVGTVTCEISGISVAGQNYFAQVASMPAGFSGAAAVVDLAPIMLPSGPEEDIVLICEGDLQGLLAIEGSQDGVRFAPIGDFRVDRRPEGAPTVLELPPLLAPDKVRYVRASLTGEVGAGGAVVTIGGAVPASGGGGAATLAETYAAGASAVDQRPVILDAKGGKIVFDASAGLTDIDSVAVQVMGVAGPTFQARWDYGIELGPDNVLIGQVGASAVASAGVTRAVAVGPTTTVRSNRGVAIGSTTTIETDADDSVAIGSTATIRATSAGGVAIGLNAVVSPGCSYSVAIGRNAVGGTGGTESCVAIGDGATVGPGSLGAVAIGRGAVAGTGGSGNSVALGAGSFLGSGCTSTLAAMGATVDSGVSCVVAIGNAIIVRNGCSSSVFIGHANTVAMGAEGVFQSTIVGYGNTVDNNSTYAVMVGPSNTIGATSASSVVIGHGSSIGASSPDNVSIGHSNTTSLASFTVVIGGSNQVTTAAPNVPSEDIVMVGRGLTTGEGVVQAVVIGRSLTVLFERTKVINIGSSSDVRSSHVVALGDALNVSTVSDASVVVGDALVVGANCPGTVIIGRSSQVGVPAVGTGSPNCILIGSSLTIGDNIANSMVFGVSATATLSNECIFGSATVPLHYFRVYGSSGTATLTLQAVDNPAAAETGLTVAYNSGVATSNKVVKAAVVPPMGAVLLYVDP